MEGVVRILKKQKNLMEIELGQATINNRFGYPPIHPSQYYAKIAHALVGVKKAITMLSRCSDDIYNNYKYIEQ